MKSKNATEDRKTDLQGYLEGAEMAGYPDKISNMSEENFPEKQQEKKKEERLARTPKGRQARISVPTFDGLQMLSVDDIVKCVAHESYTEIVLICGTKFMVSRNLKEYQDMLSEFNFFRIHNSILINLRHVKKYVRGEGGYVMMSDGQSCEVSRRKKQELVNRLSIIEF